MAALLHPQVLVAYLAMFGNVAKVVLTMHFDMLISFSITFALAYGFYFFFEKLFPRQVGSRPRSWMSPLVFLAVVFVYPLFLDSVVSETMFTLLCHSPVYPEVWVFEIAAGLWLVGFIIALIRLVKGMTALRGMANTLPLLPGSITSTAAKNAAGLTRSVAIRSGPSDFSVISCGIVRPCIIVPADFALRYSPKEQYMILLHECVHLKNRDTLKLLCISLLGAVLWFDPISRLASRRMKAEMELLCDWTLVNVHRQEPAAYAALIVKTASEQPRLVPGFSGSYRLIAGRLCHVLRDSELLTTRRVQRPIAFCLLVGLVVMVIMAVTLHVNGPSRHQILADYIRDSNDNSIAVLPESTRFGVFGTYVFSRASKE